MSHKFSIARSFDGISSLMYNKISPPFLSQSDGKEKTLYEKLTY